MQAAGSTLQNGRYIISSLIGSGGMGGVYLADDTTLQRRVAIKETVLPPGGTPQERLQAASLLEREARILAGLQHRNVVGVNDFFHQADAHYLVMDFIEGRDLQSLVDTRQGAARLDEIMGWVEQICDALEYLHTNRVLMRDLKPSNVMVDTLGRVRLIDFGIARLEKRGERTASAIKGFGTEGFAPVEQYGCGHTDARSDIYALGATIYTLVCGTRPPESVSLAAGDVALRPPTDYDATLPAALDRVLARMMSTRKEDRYATVAEARHALQTACMQTTSAPVPSLTSTSVWSISTARPISAPTSPVTGTQGLRLLEPFTIVYSGDLAGARQSLEQSLQAGMVAQILQTKDPYLSMRSACYIVVVKHVPVQGGADAWTRQAAS